MKKYYVDYDPFEGVYYIFLRISDYHDDEFICEVYDKSDAYALCDYYNARANL